MSKVVGATIPIAREVYVTLGSESGRVREIVAAAASAMERLAGESGRRLTETPRLVDQRDTGLGFVELAFHADTVKR